MTTTRSYDNLNRLLAISSQPSASGAGSVSFNYAYNDANQRTRMSLDDGCFWLYEYDTLGQLKSGKHYWSNWTPVAGQQFEYGFDDIGNRTSTKAGGVANGGGLLSANSLNQYTSRDVPGAVDILGIAHANATVTVNGQSPYRRGEYFWQELSLNNSSAAVWQSVTNIGSLSGTNQTNTGNLFLARTAEGYTCDADGNLTSDGRWTNKWDGENRLVDITSLSSGPSASRQSLQFVYDSRSRRYSKIVSNWTGSAWTRNLHELYLYDGRNLLAALNGTNKAIVKSFLWGLDLSGSMQGAGGVGGLIAFASRQSPAGTHFVVYDGNGNVMALVEGGSGTLSARYEYDPFGQTLRANGTAATLNSVRFSSKPVDDETELAYYGYRYFHPNAGCWLGRDPIAERGGKNVYGFVGNGPLLSVDKFGLIIATFGPVRDQEHAFSVDAELGFTRPIVNDDFTCTRISSGHYYLEFIWVEDVIVSILERSAISWRIDDMGILDPLIQESWGSADVDGRRELVRAHEYRHVDDLFTSYLEIRAQLERAEGDYCALPVCQLVGTTGIAAARVKFTTDAADSQRNRL